LASSRIAGAPGLKAGGERTPATVTLGARALWAGVLLVLLALAYGALGLGGLAPVPRTIESLATDQRVGRGQAIVVGLYEVQPFVANGNGLPPYALRDSIGWKIRVTPMLRDLRSVPVIAMVDLATGDGSEWSPYVIHTIGPIDAVASGAVVAALGVCALALWAGGPLSAVLRRRRHAKGPRRAA